MEPSKKMRRFLFVRFLAAFLIVGQLAWGLPPLAADTLRPGQEAESHRTGLEEALTGQKTPESGSHADFTQTAVTTVSKSSALPEPSYLILVPAYNEGNQMDQILREIKRRGYLHRVAVVDDGSGDNTPAILRQWQESEGLRVFFNPVNGQVVGAFLYALDQMKKSGSLPDYIILVDADSFLEPTSQDRSVESAIRFTLKQMQEKRLAAAGLPIEPWIRENSTWVEQAQVAGYRAGWFLRRFLHRREQQLVISGAGGVFRAEVLHRILPDVFKSRDLTQDIHLTWMLQKKGYPVGYLEDELTVKTDVPRTVRVLIRQRTRWIRVFLRVAVNESRFLLTELIRGRAFGVLAATEFLTLATTAYGTVSLALYAPLHEPAWAIERFGLAAGIGLSIFTGMALVGSRNKAERREVLWAIPIATPILLVSTLVPTVLAFFSLFRKFLPGPWGLPPIETISSSAASTTPPPVNDSTTSAGLEERVKSRREFLKRSTVTVASGLAGFYAGELAGPTAAEAYRLIQRFGGRPYFLYDLKAAERWRQQEQKAGRTVTPAPQRSWADIWQQIPLASPQIEEGRLISTEPATSSVPESEITANLERLAAEGQYNKRGAVKIVFLPDRDTRRAVLIFPVELRAGRAIDTKEFDRIRVSLASATREMGQLVQTAKISVVTDQPTVDPEIGYLEKSTWDVFGGSWETMILPVRIIGDTREIPGQVQAVQLEVTTRRADLPVKIILNAWAQQSDEYADAKLFQQNYFNAWLWSRTIGRPLAVLLGAYAGWRLYDRAIGHQETRNVSAQSGNPAAGLEEPPWPHGTGRERGIEDFPEEVRASLRAEQSFTGRVRAVARFLGWTSKQLSLAAGRSLTLVTNWKNLEIGQPLAETVRNVSTILHADPIFLLTGEAEQIALRKGSPPERVRLLMLSKGLTQVALGEKMGDLSQGTIKSLLDERGKLTRDSIFSLAEVLERNPALIETGFDVPTESQLLNPAGMKGFRGAGAAKTPELIERAQRLEETIVYAWRYANLRGGKRYPIEQWREQIEPDPQYSYPGLAARLLLARPGTLQQMAGYGLIPADVADRLSERQPLTQMETESLAASLAEAYLELEELFGAVPRLRPPQGYPVGTSGRIASAWDLIARGINRKRFLLLLNSTSMDQRKFKAQLLLSSNPEEKIVEKEQLSEALSAEFPRFPKRFIRNYVWMYRDPRSVLKEVGPLYDKLEGLGDRRWILPEKLKFSEGGHILSSPSAFAMLTLSKGLARANAYLEPVLYRDAALSRALKDPSAGQLIQVVQKIPGLASDLSAPEAGPSPIGFSEARDLLNRIVAQYQRGQPKFFSDVPSQEMQAASYALPFLRKVTEVLQREDLEERLPQDAERLEVFLETVVESLKATGLEEVEAASTPGYRATQERADIFSDLSSLMEQFRQQPELEFEPAAQSTTGVVVDLSAGVEEAMVALYIPRGLTVLVNPDALLKAEQLTGRIAIERGLRVFYVQDDRDFVRQVNRAIGSFQDVDSVQIFSTRAEQLVKTVVDVGGRDIPVYVRGSLTLDELLANVGAIWSQALRNFLDRVHQSADHSRYL